MAFAPPAAEKSAGFTVIRYAFYTDGTSIVEYIKDEIQPRTLEHLTNDEAKNARYGLLEKYPGRFFRAVPPGHTASQILKVLDNHEKGLRLLASAVSPSTPGKRGDCEICAELILHNATNVVEFYDFDFWPG